MQSSAQFCPSFNWMSLVFLKKRLILPLEISADLSEQGFIAKGIISMQSHKLQKLFP